MLREKLKSNNISVYRLAKDSGIPYSTVNDLVNFKLPVDNLKSGQLKALADALGLSMDELYSLCSNTFKVSGTSHPVTADVIVKHKIYYLSFKLKGRKYEVQILPVKSEATRYIQDLAVWKLDEILADIDMEEAYEALCAEKI